MKKPPQELTRLHNRVTEIRITRGWSQTALAQRVEIHRRSLYQIEHSQVIPSVLTALQIAHYLEVTVETLFTVERPKIFTDQEKLALDIQEILKRSRSGAI